MTTNSHYWQNYSEQFENRQGEPCRHCGRPVTKPGDYLSIPAHVICVSRNTKPPRNIPAPVAQKRMAVEKTKPVLKQPRSFSLSSNSIPCGACFRLAHESPRPNVGRNRLDSVCYECLDKQRKAL